MGGSFVIIPSSSDLQHHGILGMKWGIRRYQNKDGSLTAAGKKRREAQAKTDERKEKAYSPSIKRGKDKSPISPAEQIAQNASSAISGAKTIVDGAEGIRRTKNDSQSKVSQMSDEELERAIKRLKLEQEYERLSPKETSKGYEYIKNGLEIAGGVTAIGVSAATIAAKIWQITHGG